MKNKIIISAISITVISALIGLWLFVFQKKEVQTPDLTAKNVYEAKRIAEKMGLEIFVKSRQPSKKPKKTILWQKPLPGVEVSKGKVIEVGISSGIFVSIIPDKIKPIKYKKPETPVKKEPVQTQEIAPFNSSNISQAKYTVCIDPGHQQKADLSYEPDGPGSSIKKYKVAGGASGIKTRTPEYEITLKIGLKLKQILESKQVKVVMTRTTNDVNISNIGRAEIANNANANLFIRIHADGAADKSTNGISTLYPANNSWTSGFYLKSKKAAEIIQDQLVKWTGRKSNGIKPRKDITGFNWSKVPCVVSETGFLSNAQEDLLINSDAEQQRIANGLAEGILKYLNSK